MNPELQRLYGTTASAEPFFLTQMERRGQPDDQSYEESNASHVLTLEQVTTLRRSGKPADTLMRVVALIASRFRTDVCSAYLLEPDRSNLVLAATLGCSLDVLARCACRSMRPRRPGCRTRDAGCRGGRDEASALQVFQRFG